MTRCALPSSARVRPAPARGDLVAVNPLGDASARSFTDYGTVEIHDADLPAGVTLTTLRTIAQ